MRFIYILVAVMDWKAKKISYIKIGGLFGNLSDGRVFENR